MKNINEWPKKEIGYVTSVLILVLIALITVLASGDEPNKRVEFTDSDWVSFVEWCSENKTEGVAQIVSLNCGVIANVVEAEINKVGVNERCTVNAAKRHVATSYRTDSDAFVDLLIERCLE
jgi:hypothetical protein